MNEIDKKFLAHIREIANKRILFLPHALQQMARPDRMILEEEVQEVIFTGEIIEDYPEDIRGHSCLMSGNQTFLLERKV